MLLPASFITHKNRLTDFDKVKNIGLDAFEAEMNIKVELLKDLQQIKLK